MSSSPGPIVDEGQDTVPSAWTAWAGVKTALRSQLARSSGGFIVGAFLQKSVPLLMLPLLTRYLTPDEFGRAAMFTLAVNVLEPVVGVSSVGSVSRQYFERDRIDFANFVANCLYILVLSAVAVAALLGAALAIPASAAFVRDLLDFSGNWLWAALGVAMARYVVNVLLTLWQVSGRPLSYTALSVVQSAATLGASLVLIVGASWGWEGRAVGEVIGVATTGIFALITLRFRWIRPGITREYLTHAARFGAGLLPHLYGGLMLSAADRFFLAKMSTMEQVGLYTVAVQVSTVITVLASAFNLAWIPWLFERLKRNTTADRRRIRIVVATHNGFLVVLALLMTALAGPALSIAVGAEFRSASDFVFWLTAGAAFGGMYNMAVNPLFFANKTYLIPIATLGSGAANLILNSYAVPEYGPIGAAVSFALATLLSLLITLYLARDAVPPPTDARATLET